MSSINLPGGIWLIKGPPLWELNKRRFIWISKRSTVRWFIINLLILSESKHRFIQNLRAYPFTGQYVNEEAVSAAQVHKGLPGTRTPLCTLLSPQHLQHTDKLNTVLCITSIKTHFTSAVRQLLPPTASSPASDMNWFYRVKATFHTQIDWPRFGCRTWHVTDESEFSPTGLFMDVCVCLGAYKRVYSSRQM